MYWAFAVLTILNVLFSFIFSIVDSSKEAQLAEEREEKDRELAERRRRMGGNASDDDDKWWADDNLSHVQLLSLADGEVLTADVSQDVDNSLHIEDMTVFGGLAAMQMPDLFNDQPVQTKLKRGNSLVFVGDATDVEGGHDGAMTAILNTN